MSSRIDPLSLMPEAGPDRLYYAEGILLDAKDFNAEQTYHRGRLARVLKYVYGTGTLAGLGISHVAASNEVQVSPGLALDPVGRLIEVPRLACVHVDAWFAAQLDIDTKRSWVSGAGGGTLVADLFVRFIENERGLTPAFASGPYDALDAVMPSRVRDAYDLQLVLRRDLRDVGSVAALPKPESAVAPSSEADKQKAVLNGYREANTTHWVLGAPKALKEHLAPRNLVLPDGITRDPAEVAQDTRSVMLARLEFAVTAASGDPDKPVLKAGPPVIHDTMRRFIYLDGVLQPPLYAAG
jgi:hypothetical protein